MSQMLLRFWLRSFECELDEIDRLLAENERNIRWPWRWLRFHRNLHEIDVRLTLAQRHLDQLDVLRRIVERAA